MINRHWLQSSIPLSKEDNYSTEIIRGTIASKINGTPKGVRLSEKWQLTAAFCN